MIFSMTLKNYAWKDRYTTCDDILDSFYNQALKRSRYYYRIAGYFSSSSIAVACNGFSYFVENGEKIFMIIGNSISASDIDAIRNGKTSKEDLLRKKWSDCLVELKENPWANGRFKALAWLLAHDKLELKIGMNTTSDGEIIPSEKSYFHEKIIIFEDYEGNRLHTEGSINETARGWKENRESFSVHRSWIEGQSGHIDSAKVEFDNLWDNNDKFSRVFNIPEALKKDIISFADPEPPPLENFICVAPKENLTNEIKLRKYQQEAIEAWKNSGKCGILEMATGTGKTITGLYAVRSDFDNGNLLVIVVPQKELVIQWIHQCNRIFGDIHILECHSESTWKDEIRRFINLSRSRPSVIIVLKDTFRGALFQENIKRRAKNIILLIDEVHEMGSEKTKEIFKELGEIPFRLGLSATPNRWDEAGNLAIQDFFMHERPVYTFDLNDAIKPKEGYEKSLCDYNYHLLECSLNEDELDEYRKYTDEISKEMAKMKDNESFVSFCNSNEKLKILINNRANITKGCKARLDVVFEIVEENIDKLNKCIIYCNNIKEIKEVTLKLVHMGYDAVEYHSQLPMDQRENNLNSFRFGVSRFIVAVKCLDQGIDIPMCDSAIITSSSQNPREYIQRRGRILRLYGEDKIAEIFDIVVLPYSRNDLERGFEFIDPTAAQVIRKQLNRVKLFTESAKNVYKCRLEIFQLEKLVVSNELLD